MQRSIVVLPEPLGPMLQTTSPVWTSRSTPRSTCSLPKYFCTWAIRTIGAAAVPGVSPVLLIAQCPSEPGSTRDPDAHPTRCVRTRSRNCEANDEVDEDRGEVE